MNRQDRRFQRQLASSARGYPRLQRLIERLTAPHLVLVRLPLAVLFTLGGLFWFLPLVGLWMLPIGLLLLAVDLPALRPRVSAAMIRLRQWLRGKRRRGWF
ncbi:tryptophan synthase subunit beta [Pararhodobacter sp. SW119]|uniref:tryptophan synthase subunit beta n=1 Tax=Pararhodobacter sp. SW119 TaxID=2780075 RepID=UPI001AE04BF5|nr:tryptophan synthase subunit beta [Pararhodobacter sp. SW119]